MLRMILIRNGHEISHFVSGMERSGFPETTPGNYFMSIPKEWTRNKSPFWFRERSGFPETTQNREIIS
jgi:hypothetical protein